MLRLLQGIALLCGITLLAACQPARPPQPGSPAGSVAWPPFDYSAISARGAPVYALEPARSRVEVVVRRDGPLARFGHDHAIVLDAPRGFLSYPAELAQARAHLRFAVADLQVDPPAARARHALETRPDAAAVQGTRDNLMHHVLDPQQWPWIEIGLSEFSAGEGQVSALLDITINGRHSQSRQHFALAVADGEVHVNGHFTLQQTALGLQPFAALGGGLRVADRVEVFFDAYGTLLP